MTAESVKLLPHTVAAARAHDFSRIAEERVSAADMPDGVQRIMRICCKCRAAKITAIFPSGAIKREWRTRDGDILAAMPACLEISDGAV